MSSEFTPKNLLSDSLNANFSLVTTALLQLLTLYEFLWRKVNSQNTEFANYF